jgi:hypothetical protein
MPSRSLLNPESVARYSERAISNFMISLVPP